MSNIEKILDDEEEKYKDIFYDTYEEKLKNNPDNTLKQKKLINKKISRGIGGNLGIFHLGGDGYIKMGES